MSVYQPENLKDLVNDKFPRYRVSDLQRILKNLNLSYSIYTIRDYETYKCLNYKCGARHSDKTRKCVKCKGKVRKPLVKSPRTLGGGRGPGHRRYNAKEVKIIVNIFAGRV